MCISDAVKYFEDALKTFLNEWEKARQNGADGSEIAECANSCSTQPNSKKFFYKMLSCITCDRWIINFAHNLFMKQVLFLSV
jgi:phospholipase C